MFLWKFDVAGTDDSSLGEDGLVRGGLLVELRHRHGLALGAGDHGQPPTPLWSAEKLFLILLLAELGEGPGRHGIRQSSARDKTMATAATHARGLRGSGRRCGGPGERQGAGGAGRTGCEGWRHLSGGSLHCRGRRSGPLRGRAVVGAAVLWRCRVIPRASFFVVNVPLLRSSPFGEFLPLPLKYHVLVHHEGRNTLGKEAFDGVVHLEPILCGEDADLDSSTDGDHIGCPGRLVQEAHLSEDLSRMLPQEFSAISEADGYCAALRHKAFFASTPVGDDAVAIQVLAQHSDPLPAQQHGELVLELPVGLDTVVLVEVRLVQVSAVHGVLLALLEGLGGDGVPATAARGELTTEVCPREGLGPDHLDVWVDLRDELVPPAADCPVFGALAREGLLDEVDGGLLLLLLRLLLKDDRVELDDDRVDQIEGYHDTNKTVGHKKSDDERRQQRVDFGTGAINDVPKVHVEEELYHGSKRAPGRLEDLQRWQEAEKNSAKHCERVGDQDRKAESLGVEGKDFKKSVHIRVERAGEHDESPAPHKAPEATRRKKPRPLEDLHEGVRHSFHDDSRQCHLLVLVEGLPEVAYPILEAFKDHEIVQKVQQLEEAGRSEEQLEPEQGQFQVFDIGQAEEHVQHHGKVHEDPHGLGELEPPAELDDRELGRNLRVHGMKREAVGCE
mmetsp:Transcript_14287/g.42129  ORF Transcript_14287/g.42129 Transcript_14287/m.42129 type:complete len:674 (-) Transcript_14287:100-2121(-)